MKNKIFGLIMTYNCASLVEKAYRSLPKELFDTIICVDDDSTDDSVEVVRQLGIQAFTHPHTGYGGNLIFGLKKAFELGATHVIEIHGDAQYSTSQIPLTISKLNSGCDLILGNRYHDMLQPLRDGMDIIRYFGNIFLSTIGRIGLDISTRDLFPGFRAYSQLFMKTIDFSITSKNYFFSFEIIVLARYFNLKICQVPVQCDYKGEHHSMSLTKGIPAILHTCKTVLYFRLARHNIKLGIFSSIKEPVKKD
jgi:glycosyltransferase involved in cell wall biosynthesis|tara:strand:- start:871 stop:1623 length:753 start_codon:yes stop_codon:yes gene_type:complete